VQQLPGRPVPEAPLVPRVRVGLDLRLVLKSLDHPSLSPCPRVAGTGAADRVA
jgi:hypothetical protein